VEAKPLDVDGAQYPFWSPDSRTLAYFAQGKLRRIDVAGGPSTAICDAIEARGGAWGVDGTIVFAPHWRGPLSRVSATGGTAVPLTTLDEKQSETTHRYPVLLPDGEHYLYLAGTHLLDAKSELNAVYYASLKTKERRLLLRARSNVVYAAGHLLYLRDQFLIAQPFDADKGELTGEPRRVADGVYYESGFFRGVFAAANDGTLVFAPSGASLLSRLQWRDRTGKATEIPGEPALWRYISLSPDGRYLAAEIDDPADIWIHDLVRGTRRRLTSHPLNEIAPLWSPDGRTMVYASDRDVVFDVFARAADGSGEERPLLTGPQVKIATSWTPDGRTLIIDRAPLINAPSGDVVALPYGQVNAQPVPVVQSRFAECCGVVSPDGRWLAFLSDESGRPELYVMPMGRPGPRHQVSTAGAEWRPTMWRGDGKELFYLQRDGSLLAVDVQASGDTFEASAPKPLFRMARLENIDATPDGQRFVVSTRAQGGTPALTLVTGWNQ
jgi:eukaryotic-like serine/threonine-protein kinase